MIVNKLPIELNPVIKTYQNSAFPFSVLLAQDSDTIYFALNNFTQLYFRNYAKKAPFNFNYSWFKYWKCIDVHNIIRSDYIKIWRMPIVELIKHSIDNGGYVYAIVNEFYIPHRKSYMKFNYDHDILVYGYDEEKFYILGYDENVHYSATEVSFSEFEDAFHTVSTLQYIIFFTHAKYYKCKFDSGLNLRLINDYIESQNTSFIYPFIIDSSPNTKWGQNAVAAMLEYSKNDFNNGKRINVRFFDTYLEHKKIMKMRLKLLCEDLNCYNLYDEYERIYDESTAIKNLVIKMNITKNISDFDKLTSLVNNNLNKEKEILKTLLNLV